MWAYYPETEAAFASLSRNSERPILVVEGKYQPSDAQGAIFADALNTHEATGLTPSQLQARVAELEDLGRAAFDEWAKSGDVWGAMHRLKAATK